MMSEESRDDKPLVAITMGDPAGVGPETIIGAWCEPSVHEACRMVVVGRPAILQRAAKLLGRSVEVIAVASPESARAGAPALPCLPIESAEAEAVAPGVVDARGGQAAYDAVVRAARLALDGHVDAVVTAPLNKAALWAAGHHYPGHTELLAELCGVKRFAMMLYLGPSGSVRGRVGVGVAHVTLHCSMRSAMDQITADRIVAKAHLAHDFVQRLLAASRIEAAPRIGVAALNPHAGEGGLFGDEEQRVIAPAVRRAREAGIAAVGPLPCDALMARAVAGHFDAVVAMYHDQGHIALKTLGMHRAVNVTLGLPIVRTSVAHGTAFDLAWQGRAASGGMVEAIRLAASLVRARRMAGRR